MYKSKLFGVVACMWFTLGLIALALDHYNIFADNLYFWFIFIIVITAVIGKVLSKAIPKEYMDTPAPNLQREYLQRL